MGKYNLFKNISITPTMCFIVIPGQHYFDQMDSGPHIVLFPNKTTNWLDRGSNGLNV